MEVSISSPIISIVPITRRSRRRSISAHGKKKSKREYGSGREQFGLPPIEPEAEDGPAPKLSEYLAFGQLMGDTPNDVQRQLQLNNTAVVVEEECMELLSDWESEEFDAYAMFEALMETEVGGGNPNSTLARNKNRAGIADVMPPPPRQTSGARQLSAAQRKLARNKGIAVPAQVSSLKSLGGMLQLPKQNKAGVTSFEQLAPRPMRPTQRLASKPQRPGVEPFKAGKKILAEEEHDFLDDDDIWNDLAASTPSYADFDKLLAGDAQASSPPTSGGRSPTRRLVKAAKPPALLPKPLKMPSTRSTATPLPPRSVPQLTSPPSRAAPTPAIKPNVVKTPAPALAPRPSRPSSSAAPPPVATPPSRTPVPPSPVLAPPQRAQGAEPAPAPNPHPQAAAQQQQLSQPQQQQKQAQQQQQQSTATPLKLEKPPSRAAAAGQEENSDGKARRAAVKEQAQGRKKPEGELLQKPQATVRQRTERSVQQAAGLAPAPAASVPAEQRPEGEGEEEHVATAPAAQSPTQRPVPANSSADQARQLAPASPTATEGSTEGPPGQSPAESAAMGQAEPAGQQQDTEASLLPTTPQSPPSSIRSLTSAAVAAANWAATQRAKQGEEGATPGSTAEVAGAAGVQRPQRPVPKGRAAGSGGQLGREQRAVQRQQMLRYAREFMQRNEVLDVKVWRVNAAGVLVEGDGISGFIPMTQLATHHGKRVLEQEALLLAELEQQAQQQGAGDEGAAAGGAPPTQGHVDRTAVRRTAMGVLLGEQLAACVIVVEEERGHVVLSERAAAPRQRSVDSASAAAVVAAALPLVGQVVPAKVLSVKRFGCFVEFEIPAPLTQPSGAGAAVAATEGGGEGSEAIISAQKEGGLKGLGLVHASQMSWEPDVEPSDVVEVGQSLRAVIFHVDVSKGRVFLSLRHATTHPLQETLETLLHLTTNPSTGDTPPPGQEGSPSPSSAVAPSSGGGGGAAGAADGAAAQQGVADLREALGDMADAVRFCEAMVQVPGVVAARPGWRLQSRASSQALEVYLAREDASPTTDAASSTPGSSTAGRLSSYRLVLRKGLSVQEVVVSAKLPREEVRQLAADVVADLVAAGE